MIPGSLAMMSAQEILSEAFIALTGTSGFLLMEDNTSRLLLESGSSSVQIQNLPDGGSLLATDTLVVVRGGQNRRVTNA